MGFQTNLRRSSRTAPAISLQLYYEGEWARLSDVIETVLNPDRGARSESARVRRASSTGCASARNRFTWEIDALSAVLETVRTEHGSEIQDNKALEERVRSLESDLRRNQDAQKLQRLGSELGRAVSEHICPTCHQGVSNELLPTFDSVAMALDENVAFVKSQRRTVPRGAFEFAGTSAGDHSAIPRIGTRPTEQAARIAGTKTGAHEAKRLAVSRCDRRNRSPSCFLEQLKSVDELSFSLMDELRGIATEWAAATNALRQLPSDELTVMDRRKLEHLQTIIRRPPRSLRFSIFPAGRDFALQ